MCSAASSADSAAPLRARRPDRAAERLRAAPSWPAKQAVLAALPEAVVVRTAWVYTGGDGKDFVAVMRRLAAGDGPSTWSTTRPARRPTSATWSPRCCRSPTVACTRRPDRARRQRGRGHPASSRPARCSRTCGADPERVRPVSSAHNPRPAPRPPLLGTVRSAVGARPGLTPLRPWRDALSRRSLRRRADASRRPLLSTRD